jgi:hypothetical protein
VRIVELTLTVDFRKGEEFVRDDAGLAQGVVDATFAELRWATGRLGVQESV